MVVRNRAGQTTDSVLEVADKASVSHVLRIAVAPDAVLCTDGSNFLAAVAKAPALEHQPVDVQSGVRVRGAWHIQNVSGISLAMYSAFTLGITLWLIYGLLLQAWPIVVANVITLALALAILRMKLAYGKSHPS